MSEHVTLAARFVIATLDHDKLVQELVGAEVAERGEWPAFAAALASLAAMVCREIDDPEDSRALWLHSLAARI